MISLENFVTGKILCIRLVASILAQRMSEKDKGEDSLCENPRIDIFRGTNPQYNFSLLLDQDRCRRLRMCLKIRVRYCDVAY